MIIMNHGHGGGDPLAMTVIVKWLVLQPLFASLGLMGIIFFVCGLRMVFVGDRYSSMGERLVIGMFAILMGIPCIGVAVAFTLRMWGYV